MEKETRTTNNRICEYCGDVIIKPTNRQKYHNKCSKKVRKNKRKIYDEDYEEKTKETRLEIRKELKRKDYHKHRTKRNITAKKWRSNNKEKLLEYNRNNKFKRDIVRETHKKFIKDNKCKMCEKRNKLEIHHIIYESPVKKEHIITLCRDCHSLIHRSIDKYERI